MAENIWQKRKKALLCIAGLAGGNVVIAAPPKPGGEIPSHIALTGADFVMCGMIYETYFGEKVSKSTIVEILGVGGVIVAVAGGGGYAIAKTASGFIAELANLLGPLGWMASGLLAAGGTTLLGLCWMMIVDSAYGKKVTLREAVSGN